MSTSASRRPHTDLLSRATELRMIIAILFAVYGVVCLIWSAFTTPHELAKAAGINVNLWTGIGMLVVAAFFFAWAFLKPLTVEESGNAEAREDVTGDRS